jgi:uncharacterized protein
MALLVFCAWMLPASAGAQDIPELRGRVNDYAGVLGDTSALEAKLAAEEQRAGNQVVVLTVADLGGQDIESYANAAFHQWRLGHKGVDNGVLIVLAVKDRRARIEVGYGLEGDLTDVASSLILREQMHPLFAQGDYAGGINAGVDGVLGVLAGATVTGTAESTPHQNGVPIWISIFLFVLTVLFSLMAASGGGLATLWVTPLCSIFLFVLWPWYWALAALLGCLVGVYAFRRQNMRRAFTRKGTVRKAFASNHLTDWPPSLWQVMLWVGAWTSTGSRSSSSSDSSSWSSSSSSSDGSSSSSSSDSSFSGDGGDSGGGGSSDSW